MGQFLVATNTDDFIILVKSQRAGERVLRSISRYLHNRLQLVINTDKSQVVNAKESKFLGFTFKNGRIQWHEKTLLKFKQKIRQLTNRNWGVSMKYQLFKTSQYLRGWIQYFGIANCYQLCCDLDHWIRRRVRMAYWRQWRKPRTKIRNLMRLSSMFKLLSVVAGPVKAHGAALNHLALIRHYQMST